MAYTIEEYRPEEAGELIALWNGGLGADYPMTDRLWRQNVDTDPNYAPGDGLIARTGDGKPAGFVLTRVFRDPKSSVDLGNGSSVGWIMALVVAPEFQRQGLGGQLLALAEDRLRQGGASQCDLGGSLGHFLPGQPSEYADALGFWDRHGYVPGQTVYDLRQNLAGWTPPAPPESIREGDYSLTPGQPGEEDAILAFVRQSFPGRWLYETSQKFARGATAEDVMVLKDRGGGVQGFLSLWDYNSPLLGSSTNWYPALGPWFGGIGPLGVAEEVRGRGLGLALVAAGTAELKARGVEESAIDWTGLVDFYGRLGYRVWKQYTRFEPKALTE